ncbi:hypothetical protein ACFWBS_49830 [Streptomyces mirabilis]|uniref:hypothetical protein n=1 Tax=Streptomyces TaxID=1883 RepID=UPI00211BAC2C|nr:hypothetical protein [Streptomyces sp. OK228]
MPVRRHRRVPDAPAHPFAALKNWRILTRLRLNPTRATNLLRALLVLTNLETSR